MYNKLYKLSHAKSVEFAESSRLTKPLRTPRSLRELCYIIFRYKLNVITLIYLLLFSLHPLLQYFLCSHTAQRIGNYTDKVHAFGKVFEGKIGRMDTPVLSAK